ncbi:unnamed protein product [Bemisia tabaci]|uniref:Large ribosomal subunit protein eL34 n=1 Tax=Bemisia tabaci TaxID=7038 RepID=A0A9P0AHC0_BEMTA|nr:PREDICTED: 60S ribosomal protein L34-like [Bemisia tabaci]CAH0392884.1 unnamed protein product [Bemisia tabaci]
MVQRVVLRRRLSYNTNSNKRKVIRTPGGRYVYHYLKKKGSVPTCGDCRVKLQGCTPSRPFERSRINKRRRSFNRAYGGQLCHKCVTQKIVRAFLLEEQKLVKKLLRAQRDKNKGKEVKKDKKSKD